MRSHKAIVHEALAAGIALLVIAAPATSAPPGPFKQTNIHFETNASGCDMGIQMSFDTPGTARAHVQAGKMRPLAVTGAKRSPVLPDVPTFAEAGFPSVEGEI